MKKFLLPTILVILSSCFLGCDNFYTKRHFANMIEHRIKIPETLIPVCNDKSFCIQPRTPLFVLYIDSTECSSCRLNNLTMYESFANSIKPVDFYVIFSPTKKEQNHLKHLASRLNTSFQILFDTLSVFQTINPSIPNDHRFHAFLLDKEGYPVFIGDPVYNKRLYPVFLNEFQQLKY